MIKSNFLKTVLTLFFLLLSYSNGYTCSMYKITIGNKTIVGTNFDAYYTAPRIWFENAVQPGTYGAAFSGGRISGVHGYAPQSGMNEAGLSFSRLATATPQTNIMDMSRKKPIPNECSYLKDILHTCKTVEEVKRYISQYNHSFFLQDVFIYIEKSGRYLIVEPYTMTLGNEARYVLSNFCPSVTDATYANKLDRYRKGVELLNTKVDTTPEFCKALSDSMHVCRKKIGDGTLLSSNWDLKTGNITLYFYHDYTKAIHYNLKEELAKGDHFFEIPKLFPPNAEFQKMLSYKVPQNTPGLELFLLLCGGLFIFSSLYFLVSFIRTRKTTPHAWVKITWFPLGMLMAFYMYSLFRNVGIFYNPVPYQDYVFTIQNIMAYVPFLVLFLIIPLAITYWKIIQTKTWSVFSKLLLTANHIALLILIGWFAYWGLYTIF
ncbi:Ntn hydrolase family protein [Flavobacterium phycosphaerae]|uniref:hypothetical protein n=1 Tax=Flavobacterium phycosphaerae TaxID=2697515 RepID=UPI001389BFA5|nr:hypothetical protein [Flavobacterium phycosphaerae]